MPLFSLTKQWLAYFQIIKATPLKYGKQKMKRNPVKTCVYCGYPVNQCDCGFTMVPPKEFDDARRKSTGTEFQTPGQVLAGVMEMITKNKRKELK
jgi:hypothetical protein